MLSVWCWLSLASQSTIKPFYPLYRLYLPSLYTCQAVASSFIRVCVQVWCIAGSASTICLGFSDKNVDTSGVFYVYGLPALIGGKPWLQSPGHGRLRSDNLGHEWTPLREYHSLGTDPGVFCALLQCHSFILKRSCLPGRDSFLCTIILELFTTL